MDSGSNWPSEAISRIERSKSLWLNKSPGRVNIWRRTTFSLVRSLPLITILFSVAYLPSEIRISISTSTESFWMLVSTGVIEKKRYPLSLYIFEMS